MDILKNNKRSNKSKFEKKDPLVWILDEDFDKSVNNLSNNFLDKTISNLVKILISVRWYYLGVRNRKAYDFYMSLENREKSMERFFPGLTYNKKIPYIYYSNRVTKWARKCQEHYCYFLSYLDACTSEWLRRKGKLHKQFDLIDFIISSGLENDIPKANLKKITLEWKVIPISLRSKNVIESYRKFYAKLIGDPLEEYKDSKVDIPDFVLEEKGISSLI